MTDWWSATSPDNSKFKIKSEKSMRTKTTAALLLLILALFALLQPPSSTPARAQDNLADSVRTVTLAATTITATTVNATTLNTATLVPTGGALAATNIYGTNITAGALSLNGGGLTFTNGYKVFTNIIWPSILTLTNAETTVAVTGAKTNDFVLVAPPTGLDQGLIASGRVTSDGVVTVRLANFTAITLTPITNTWRLAVLAIQ